MKTTDRPSGREPIGSGLPPHPSARERYAPCPLFEPPDRHAEVLRNVHGISDGQPVDVMAIIEGRGWHVVRRSLGATHGGLQAAIVPSRRSEFRIAVDSEPAPTEVWEHSFRPAEDLRHALERSRLAHELGHTFFYRVPNRACETSPVRLAPPKGKEEAFCDQFAASLLVPPSAARTAVKGGAETVLQLAHRLVAPVAAVFDAAATDVRAAAGLAWCRPGGLLIRAEPLLTYNLSDSCLVWDQEPTLWRALVDRVAHEHSGAVSFLAVCPTDAPLSLLVSSWPVGEPAPQPRYLVGHADMGLDTIDARAGAMGLAG